LIWILEVAAKTHKRGRIIFHESLELFELHNAALGFNTQDPTKMRSMHRGPGGAGELAASEGSPELAHKRHWTAIELTTDRPAKEDWPGTSPAGDGGGSVAAGPLRLQFR
jgi:hypothetical protein